MNESQEKKNPAFMAIIGIAAVVILIGVGYLILGKAQSADPTMTQAPPPGPNAQILQPSAAKRSHHLAPRNPVTGAPMTDGAPAPAAVMQPPK